jgi:hypothetical protein
MTSKRKKNLARPILSFVDALARAKPRPADNAIRKYKKNYAERLSNALAVLIAGKLRVTRQFEGVLPDEEGHGRESRSASGALKKAKKTDVRYATSETGLELLVSIKTLNFRDAKRDKKTKKVVLGRYTKNMVRNDHELRAEAMDHHDRFPYAVLVGLFFLPVEACDDGQNDKSSFAHAVMTLRPRAGRTEPTDHPAKFERLFIGLYRVGGDQPDVGLFDVNTAPPRRGRPPWHDEVTDEARGGRLLCLDEVVAEIIREYGIRNRTYIRWADEVPNEGVPAVVVTADEDAEEDEESDGAV